MWHANRDCPGGLEANLANAAGHEGDEGNYWILRPNERRMHFICMCLMFISNQKDRTEKNWLQARLIHCGAGPPRSRKVYTKNRTH